MAHLDRATDRPIRRYEHDLPGSLVHIDVRNSAHPRRRRAPHRRPRPGCQEQAGHHQPAASQQTRHTALDDHSRLAYTEILPDECKDTAAAFLIWAAAWFASRKVTIQRVLTDNGACYTSRLWAAICVGLGITHKCTRPYRRRPTARSNASTAPWPTDGPMPAPMSEKPNAALIPGCTCTTITADTPR
ncbi:hypothetical protein GCM10010116_60710 [Microbispora rosea subsp. aerata]|nr:DDE-type integrase/transposase/recombinase [Microbispora rosea]GGO30312.1 hypothetical protein GCM10010116_60710 [Microbispora rosea subsp. aerata]GIH59096.1 hypothetical protein Mro02_60100 [Microbispora rosea subsp. aerata]GLJ85863.1 hypothetical protein GCM10017588_45960 [Microbispora rosea subsp. aerata]